jgi:hypothetical protein
VQLCLCGRWDQKALEAARSLAAQHDFDWDALCQVAQAGGSAPLLWHTTRHLDLLPSAVAVDLLRSYYQSAAANLAILRELERVLQALGAEGIPAVLLKGAALASTVYGDPALRPMADLDLLVRQADAPRALQALSTLGYHRARGEPHPGDALNYENETVLRQQTPLGTLIEVHWSLFDSPYHQHALCMDWFWQTALPSHVGDAKTVVLGPEAQVLHLCGHLMLHHGDAWETRLLWLNDIAEVIIHYQGQLDWDHVLAHAQAFELVLPLQRIVPHMAEAWGAPIPRDVLDRLRSCRPSREEARVFARLVTSRRPVAQRFWADLAGMPEWADRVRFAWRNLLPSASYMRQRYQIPHRLLVPLYYPYRWFLGLRSALTTLFASPR